ncbi:kyphoscoliosis peptidase-like [Pomacea canaliculata]|uniref:kyphoscoliosis peptidase-like n=1 Tax=Pomacea canaliculata TaxID=400727 RepID=UPI000D7329BF|nr:kyphoscoliosis peptidase-like [Pomacea canaliculata]XP_025111836.1 kyphoscoliosis peptidase-like [Pomacea canaliculata]XP_025111837.1 kyphoscoliosis peptidase-like [Pomacea canaliculata]
MNQDKELWELEDWYPPLCPPETLKEELLQNEDFTEVDKDARAKLNSPKDSFDKLVQHLTSHLSSDLHKLRAIFVWMGAQNIGCRQETGRCEDNNSPDYYIQEASKNNSLIDKMFAKMCRAARIPCLLVNGNVKGVNYETGDVEINGEGTWAVVYVANSWRFVFPYWAFVVISGYQKENFVLVEDSGKPKSESLTANAGTTKHNFDEFYFLTDPEEMIYICHPYDKEKQLLTEPWTQEKFVESPHLRSPYFSSGWKLTNPLMCVIKSTTGWCLIDMFSQGGGYKLKYSLLFDEGRSGRKFPKEIPTELYVTIIRRTQKTDSFLVRLPVKGTYKFRVLGAHGNTTSRLVEFQIVCDDVAPDTHPFPTRPENGFGFGEAAAEAGLSEASHTEGVVPVKSGDEICMRFKVRDHVDISARLIHSTRTPEELRDNVIVERKGDNITVTVRLPADDPKPEYSLEVDTITNRKENDQSTTNLFNFPVLNYLLTSDETLNAVIRDEDTKKNLQFYEDAWVSVGNDDAEMLEKIASRDERADIKDPILDRKIREKEKCYKRMTEEVRVSAQERNFNELNRSIRNCIAANLHHKREIEDAMKILMTLCQEEMEKAVKSNNLEELRACFKKIDNTCVSKMAREQAWFEDGQEEIKKMVQSLRKKDEATEGRPPDHVCDVIVAAFILIGENEEELDTWQKINGKLKETNEEQLINNVNSLDKSSLTRQRVDLAEQKLERAVGTFAEYRSIETLKKQCMEKITFYRTKGSLKRRN